MMKYWATIAVAIAILPLAWSKEVVDQSDQQFDYYYLVRSKQKQGIECMIHSHGKF